MNDRPIPNGSFVEYEGENINNRLVDYIHSLSPETARELSKLTPEAWNVIQGNIAGMLGSLSPQMFQTNITTDAENFRHLLFSAMVTGYFLKSAETRMAIEQSFQSKK